MVTRRRRQSHADKKVTDYFTRRSSGSQTLSPNASEFATPLGMPRTDASASRPMALATKREDGVATLTDPMPAESDTSHTITTRSVAKRVRSPEAHLGTSYAPVLRKSSNKRARVEETPPEPARLPVTLTSPKEEHAARPPVSSPASSEQLIHTSQSDEMDLTFSTPSAQDSDQVRKNIEQWKKCAVSFTTPPKSRQAVREDTPLSPLTSLATSPGHPVSLAYVGPRCSADFTCNTNPPESPVQSPVYPLSPSDTGEISSSPLPPTPKALDPDAKAVNLIAEIKARASASVCLLSDDEKPLEYRALDESDEDDFSLSPICIGKRARDRRDVVAPLLTGLSSTSERPSSGLRHSVPTRPPEEPSPSRPPKRFRKTAPVSLGKDSSSRRKKTHNPLDELLREKKAADKRGTSSAALRQAENAIKQSHLVSLDDHAEYDLDFMDEGAARRAVQDVRHLSSLEDESDFVDPALDFQDTTKILGSDAAEAINKILVSDRITQEKDFVRAAKRERSFGVSLWKPCSIEDMNVDQATISRTLFEHASPITALLDQLVRSGDDVQLELLLNSGLLINIPSQELPLVLSSLFTNGLCSSTPVADATYNALRDVCAHRKSEAILPFSAVRAVLLRLGARPPVFEQVGWQSDDIVQDRHFSPEIRSKLLLRFTTTISMVASFPSLTALMPSELADFVLCIVLLGLDPTTPRALDIHLNSAIDAICIRSTGDSVALCSIYRKLLTFASNLNSANRARLVSLFSSGGSQARLIGQWLAYCLLIPSTTPLTDQFPALEPLILLLSPPSDSGQLFDVTNENIDYEDLDHCVAILAVALTDIAPYVREERSLVRRPSITSGEGGSSNAKKIPMPLERLHSALNVLQGKIVDTRAAYLDRSRVKAAIQRLAMRIYYDRLAIKGGSSRGRASTLQNWFSPSR
ncbi:hypothetical protein EDD17DRAFT_1857004 [Pisolithus thermaeus]|nr:hypothetical protein EV401DRAFT_2159756 [Pisolithus croceorrhizus]KAI6149994.1 hypothetical protein EDD17DRAFT_1857004 [Pisolithus thermaeus]